MAETSGRPFYLVFTDLDGTLLDRDTYEWKEAEPALDRCRSLSVPVILVSSKTRAEVDLLRRRLSLPAPFISENGGGIFLPKDAVEKIPGGAAFFSGPGMPDATKEGDLWKWSLGTPYRELVRALKEIREEIEWDIRGFSDMSLEEISSRTGLNVEESRLAVQREFDEPFVVLNPENPDRKKLLDAARRKGLSVSEGGRFFHLQGANDKGLAMEKLATLYGSGGEPVVTVALGDSPNDFSMLQRADVPVLVRSGREFPMLAQRIPGLRVTAEIGPRGWNAAVLDILDQ